MAIGATMVGSIEFLKEEGDYVHKGDEVFFTHLLFHATAVPLVSTDYLMHDIFSQFGYFAFGGSTVICVFEKVSISRFC